MALTPDTRAATAFKKLSGFINSGNGTSFFSEVVPTQISIATQEIIGRDIPADPTQLSDKKKVDLELVKNPSSGFGEGQGYDLALPQGETLDLPTGQVVVDDGASGNAPLNRLLRGFQIQGGGSRSIQIISQKYNSEADVDDSTPGYRYIFFSDVGNNDEIPRADDSQWQVDPVAGVIVASANLQNNEGLANVGSGEVVTDAALRAYVYTGPTLEYRVENAVGGGGGATGLSGSQGPGIVVYDFNASTGETSLAYDATEVITNIGSPGTTGIEVSTDNTGNQEDPANYDVTFSVDRSVLDDEYLEKGTSGSPVNVTTYGTYNFNGTSEINVGSGTFVASGSSGQVTMSAGNAQLNSAGTLSVDGNINATDPNNSGLGTITAVDFTETSSVRYKSNISALDSALDLADNLMPKWFEFDGQDGQQLGFIAEEVADVLPEVVNFDDGQPEALNYGRLSAVAIGAIKELREENRELRRRLRDLE
jgi:hypothetical protein